ncbi:MAG: RHS repeat domain-containing protein, partial [Halioglobus sp.]
YGPNRSRYMRIDRANSQETKTRYLRNVEKITKPDGSELIKRHLGNVLITLSVNQTDTASVTNYILKDHLGSLDVTTDKNGSERQFYEFDAWGKRRGINGLDLSASELMNFDTSTTTRGFTGHEILDQVGVIHMNGRIYDPVLGRFLQADPFVESPTDTQSYSRYTYVHNNPLKYTDPSGFFSLGDVAKIAIVAVISYYTFNAASYWGVSLYGSGCAVSCNVAMANFIGGATGGAAAGFAAGVSMAALSGASFGNALQVGVRGAIAGAVTGGIAGKFHNTYSPSRVLADGIGNGVSAQITGGNFRDGLRYGLVSSLATYTNVKLREYEIRHSKGTAGQIGRSRGFRGVVGKIGGGRIVDKLWAKYGEPLLQQGKSHYEALRNYWQNVEPSLLGCHQGGTGCIISDRFTYTPDTTIGRLIDYVVEGFGGSHDYANHWYHYNPNGTAIYRQSGSAGWYFGEALNWANVALVSPIVLPSLVPDYSRFFVLRQ